MAAALPQLLGERIEGNHTVCIVGEELEQLELLVGEVDGGAAHRCAVVPQIQAQVSKLEHLSLMGPVVGECRSFHQ